LLLIGLLAGGCESFDSLSPQRTGVLLRTIQLGMTEEEVAAQLGKPQKQEVRGETKFLFYSTPWQVAEKAKQKSPIAIKDGNVVGMGVTYLARFSPPDDKWITLGDRSPPPRAKVADLHCLRRGIASSLA
jgi:hypothetical protein